MTLLSSGVSLLTLLALPSIWAQRQPQHHISDENDWLCCRDRNDQTIDGCHCGDRVTEFPGWTNKQPLPSSWYSGYLTYELEGRKIHTHYMLVLAEESSGTKQDDMPLIYWSNGGPGAPSMFGLLTELGPLLLSDLSTKTDDYRETKIPTPIYNPYSWSKLGHILIIDQPAPVGFSYCELVPDNSTSPDQDDVLRTAAEHAAAADNDDDDDDPPVDCAGLAWTDELAATNAYTALQAFYAKYPKMLNTDLYLTGESYAGIYVPTLARAVLDGNKELLLEQQQRQRRAREEERDENNDNNEPSTKSDVPAVLPLRGFAVGDGCLGTETGICSDIGNDDAFDFWLVFFLAGHNQIPLNTYQEVLRACRPFDDNHAEFRQQDVCKAAVEKVRKQAGGVYDYGLYDECTYSNGLARSTMDEKGETVQGAVNDYPCGGDIVMEEWLGLDVVKKALHVEGVDFFSADNAEGFAYTPTERDLSGFYRDTTLNTNLSILVYNGDTDPAITSFATQNWTSHLGLPLVEDWTPWTVDGCRRMGGYVTRYHGGGGDTGGKLDFLTIRGSGHLVPAYKSAAAFTFLRSWLHAEEYPPYVENCTAPDSKMKEKELFTSQESISPKKQYIRVAA